MKIISAFGYEDFFPLIFFMAKVFSKLSETEIHGEMNVFMQIFV